MELKKKMELLNKTELLEKLDYLIEKTKYILTKIRENMNNSKTILEQTERMKTFFTVSNDLMFYNSLIIQTS